jgi:DNA-directed RNA polymerase omega subunit
MLSKTGGGIFSLARIAMIRSLEIHFGKPPLIKHMASDKATTIALKEIGQGKIAMRHKVKTENTSILDAVNAEGVKS